MACTETTDAEVKSQKLHTTPLAVDADASLRFTAGSISAAVFSYTGAGVVGQCAIVGQGDVFLLPLLIQRATASLPQDALSRRKKPEVSALASDGSEPA